LRPAASVLPEAEAGSSNGIAGSNQTATFAFEPKAVLVLNPALTYPLSIGCSQKASTVWSENFDTRLAKAVAGNRLANIAAHAKAIKTRFTGHPSSPLQLARRA
jgi:hypothetical protein